MGRSIPIKVTEVDRWPSRDGLLNFTDGTAKRLRLRVTEAPLGEGDRLATLVLSPTIVPPRCQVLPYVKRVGPETD